jgi:hypothetical protein
MVIESTACRVPQAQVAREVIADAATPVLAIE